MGIAVLSAVLDSLETRQAELSQPTFDQNIKKSAPSTGTSTPTSSFYAEASDAAMPSRFIATVGRDESVRKLRKTFKDIGGLAESVEVLAGDSGNLKAVTESDVVLVWCVHYINSPFHQSTYMAGSLHQCEATNGQIYPAD
jgi:pyrroline-5-carboxylate reductase